MAQRTWSLISREIYSSVLVEHLPGPTPTPVLSPAGIIVVVGSLAAINGE